MPQRPSRRSSRLLVGALVLAVLGLGLPSTAALAGFTGRETPRAPRLYGTLQSAPERVASNAAAGVRLVTLSVAWHRAEPREGHLDGAYLRSLRDDLAQYRRAGMQVVLSPGVQYPPGWLFDYPNSRFQNQYGDTYAPTQPGKNVANMVFNQQMRAKQQAYLGRVFEALGTDFYAVRLGGGWYGELNYPEPGYAGRSNAYWAFDPVAQGKAGGLPAGMAPSPVPGWQPGTPSPDHDAARRFAEWYLESLRNYHDWQIRTARRWYPGRLLMLYPSWGVRPGQLEVAVAADLAGTTAVERNGEVQRGFDFARYIRGITDPGVVVQTTWLDADPRGDRGRDPQHWSPVKWLSHLATDRPVPLAVMGENSGHDTVRELEVAVRQARAYGLLAVVWAFEPELYGDRGHASIRDYAAAIAEDRRRR